MITLRKAAARGHADHGWLDSRHTFSFGEYHDPQHMGFRTLRVMNEDRVEPGKGFGTHPHRDMEILSYVLSGELEHRDSMGNGEVLRPGEFQRMTAGTGITHSEFNPSPDHPTHFYQVWITPNQQGLDPEYEQRSFDPDRRQNRLQMVASPDGEQESLRIHHDTRVYLSDLDAGASTKHDLAPGRHAWLQVLRGAVRLHDAALVAGDGAAVSEESELRIEGVEAAEVMLFDLA